MELPVRVPWRDGGDYAAVLAQGEAGFGADGAAASLHQQGARFVSLADPVGLGSPDPHQALLGLALVRELTSYGIAVDWQIDLGAAVADGRLLNHLCPPRAVRSAGPAADILRGWRESYHITRCGYRCGPQFVEVRDYRTGTYRRLVIRNPRRPALPRPAAGRLVDLALAPEDRRGHGALYGGLDKGRVDIARLRRTTADCGSVQSSLDRFSACGALLSRAGCRRWRR